MTTAINSSTDVSSLVTSNSPKSTALSDANASQDRFLKLLVAQLSNQDPMNPMDNAQMTSQMAQINTVSGIQQVNESIKSLTTQFASMQMLQGANMIGHDVLMQSNTLSINAGKAAGVVDLPGYADKVSVQILSPAGKVVDTLNLGAMTAGRHDFTWDASHYTGGANPTFKVTATQGNKSMEVTSLARDTVESIGTDGTNLTLQLKGRAAVTYGDIQAIL
ncbi:MAG: flagellar biosynthesis protein FlgD [Burkholderiales bacterium RIFCSPLOWO2_12_FULL_61_40]|nr:MAG: flagellar biosynthesis protein FlgD [Burkholderiales bacterium RIFCSPLOWO2_12_FULL_61_40]